MEVKKKIAVLRTSEFLAHKGYVHQSMSSVHVHPLHPRTGSDSERTHVTVSTGFPGAVRLAGPCVPIGPRGPAASTGAYYIPLRKLPLSVLLAGRACHHGAPSQHQVERGPWGIRASSP